MLEGARSADDQELHQHCQKKDVADQDYHMLCIEPDVQS